MIIYKMDIEILNELYCEILNNNLCKKIKVLKANENNTRTIGVSKRKVVFIHIDGDFSECIDEINRLMFDDFTDDLKIIDEYVLNMMKKRFYNTKSARKLV